MASWIHPLVLTKWPSEYWRDHPSLCGSGIRYWILKSLKGPFHQKEARDVQNHARVILPCGAFSLMRICRPLWRMFKGTGSGWLRVTHKPWGLEITSRCTQISNILNQTSWIKHQESNLMKQSLFNKNANQFWNLLTTLKKQGMVNSGWKFSKKIKSTWASGWFRVQELFGF